MIMKLLSRSEFREQVFERDNHRCVFCKLTADQTPEGKLDAHHLIERRLFTDGGYYLDNGVTVCESHHLACEQTLISVEHAREQAGIKKIVVPDQFYPEQPITKWGDYLLDNGRRTKGELFYDESVQKVLKSGGVLELYTPYVKYGRTFHLPWSPGIHDDDKIIKTLDQFVGQRVIVTEKFDGENTSMYRDHIHARSLDSKGGVDRAWVKKFWSNFAHDIPDGWRICGENMWAEHSIRYDDLESYFYGFSIWDDLNHCLPWDETMDYFEIFSIKPVPVLYDGIWNDEAIRKIRIDPEYAEGYVVRLANGFPFRDFKTSIAKWVRPGHVQTTKHWRAGRSFTCNELAPQKG